MATYRCLACGHLYTEENEDALWNELDDDWCCPVCGADKSFFENEGDEEEKPAASKTETKEAEGEYLAKWKKSSDPNESHLNDIHTMAETGESISEPMKTKMPIVSWDDVLIKGAQLSKIPLDKTDAVNTQTVIGKNAQHPLIIETPIYVSHMSFGALSKEIKTAMAKGSAAVKTVMCSGEGGVLPDEIDAAYKYIYEYVPNEYSLNDDILSRADAVEIKIGQSVKPGMGGHLPANKVTEEIAEIRGKKAGEDIYSPTSFKDIKSKEDLKAKVSWLREKTGGKPIGVKIAAGNIEEDLTVIIYAEADFITIDGRGGATGSANIVVKDATSVPTLFALYRAKRFLEDQDRNDISLIITGGLRLSSDFAKAIALGADAVAVATAAMIAGGCQQYRICNSGNCPVGIATQDPELRKRLDIDKSAKRIENYLKVCTEELKDFARLTGYNDIHQMNIKDLCTVNKEISDHTDIEHV
ncbi:glutamate synthase-related protein [Labilibacter marinus]|uniref:glutamate synthase-related protein n=1 Tax=Labilibacter marinus TaxID=1477105 RepID=UPI00094F8357|nr:glutamate synthase-related protein [Labilibacter marinus]